tara:strand:- start:1807 stop:2268 length:462 start_codon:yes stop_codon:yes gene_type:complete
MKKEDYKENLDTLVTFGEEGLTMRKDDPKTKEFKESVEKHKEKKRKELIKNKKASLWEDMNLSNARAEGEEFPAYKERMKINKIFMKIYKQMGDEKCRELYPQGFKYAIIQAMEAEAKEKGYTTVDSGLSKEEQIAQASEKNGGIKLVEDGNE